MSISNITLAFTIKENKSLVGILKSYIIKSETAEDLLKEVFKLAKDFEEIHEANYVGIVDVVNSPPLKEGEILGWESYEDIHTLSSAKKELIPKGKPTSRNLSLETISHFGVSIVYFYNDQLTKENNFAFSILTIVKSNHIEEAFDIVCKLAIDKKMINKIVKYSEGQLASEDIVFVGLKDFFSLDKYEIKKGNFQSFYKQIKSPKEIHDLVLEKADVNKLLKKLFAKQVF
jgi:hypothetical protein